MTMDILDSATLQRIQCVEFSQETPVYPLAFAFSPDSRTLTCSGRDHDDPKQGMFVVTWDLQTGGVVSAIRWQGPNTFMVRNPTITYSKEGRVVGLLYWYHTTVIISVYDIISGVHIHDLDLSAHIRHMQDSSSGSSPHFCDIWTHGESLRFATVDPTAITIWEVGFTRGATPVEVEALSFTRDVGDPLRETDDPRLFDPPVWQRLPLGAQFLPDPSRFAIINTRIGGGVQVWDARSPKLLLYNSDGNWHDKMTFSSDGRLFACSTVEPEVFLWQESSIGYKLVGKLTSSTGCPTPLLSPNGKSIIAFSGPVVQLWRTEGPAQTSSFPTDFYGTENFFLDFLPDRRLVAVARQNGETVTIFSLGSSIPQLIIDTSTKVNGLRVTGDAITVISSENIATWNLQGGDLGLPHARMNNEDVAQTIQFGGPTLNVVAASVSTDSHYVATLEGSNFAVYTVPDGEWLGGNITYAIALCFAPGEHKVYCTTDGNDMEVVTITQDGLDRSTPTADIEHRSWRCPWEPSCDYRVTNDWWILGSGGKRLLMLPPPWQSNGGLRVWSGQFLALVHGTLAEPVILDLEP